MVSFLNFPYRDIIAGKFDVKPVTKTAKEHIPLILTLLDEHPELRNLGCITRYLFRNDESEAAVWLSAHVSWFQSLLVDYFIDNPNDPINFIE